MRNNDRNSSSTKKFSRSPKAEQVQFRWKGPAPQGRLVVANMATPRGVSFDFQCNGTADEAVINAALAALPEGGEVVLLAGEYRLKSRIVLRRRGIGLRGEVGSVLVREFYDCPEEQGAIAVTAEGCRVRSLRLDGLCSSVPSGYEGTQCALTISADDTTVSALDICGVFGLYGDACGIDLCADRCRIDYCRITGCFAPLGDAYGILVYGRENILSSCRVSASYAKGNCCGIQIRGENNLLRDNMVSCNVSSCSRDAEIYVSEAGVRR